MSGKKNGKEKLWKILEVKEGSDELFDLGIVWYLERINISDMNSDNYPVIFMSYIIVIFMCDINIHWVA